MTDVRSEITMAELLDDREERVRIQERMLKDKGCPLICFTMNIAGPVKTSPLIVRAFEYGKAELKKCLKGYSITAERTEYKKSGPVYFCSVEGKCEDIKDLCVKVEESCPMGRLFDMDVIDTGGKKLQRSDERCCIVCGKAGRVCSAGRLHSVAELRAVTGNIMIRHFAGQDVKMIGELARDCLIDEVYTTPKPGLVDLANNGSHRDMDPETFKKSAYALEPYFEECVRIGIDSADDACEETFAQLRSAGIKAEKAMYEATGGVNTHKGIIYSMGVVLGALGRLWSPDMPIADTAKILDECSRTARKAAEEDLACIDGSTAGGRLYLKSGIRGIRGEVADGLPSVKDTALPVYKKELARGKNKNDAGVVTLLHLIAQIYDTSIFNRGGEEGVIYARKYANKLIGRLPSITDVEEMDKAFTAKNLSPGGCADLLAVTYFLAEAEGIREKYL